MSFSVHNRRLRAPQEPYLRIAIKCAAVALLAVVCVLYVVFGGSILAKRAASSWANLVRNADDSNRAFGFTNYRKALNKSMSQFWTSIEPSFKCPSRLFSKVGSSRHQMQDNGKWVCGLKTLAKLKSKSNAGIIVDPPCIVYSFLMEGETYFESEILQSTNCSVYLHDPARWIAGPPLELSTSSRLHFQKLTLGEEDKKDKRTLELLLEVNGHRWIDILKIDLNTGEYLALERILSDFRATDWPIGQLLVKFHVPDWKPVSRTRWLVAVFEMLENRGLRLFHMELSPYSPCCAEFSFINVNALEKYLEPGDIELVMFNLQQEIAQQ